MQIRSPAKAGWTRYLRPISFETALEMESTLFAVRLVESAKLHHRLIRRSNLMDEDVLILLGFQLVDEDDAGTASQLHKALMWQKEHLAQELGHELSRQTRNLQKLGGYLHFSKPETMAVQLGLLLAQSSGYSDLFRIAGQAYSAQAKFGLFARGLGVAASDLRAALRTESRPARMGLIDLDSIGVQMLPSVPDNIREALDFEDFNEERLLRHLVRRAPEPKLAVSDYEHVAQVGPLLTYLEHALADAGKGVNVLLYGPPGTGKTELTRTLAGYLHSQLYEVPNEDETGGATSGRERFGAYVLSQQVLATQRHTLLLFDEAEDVFGVEGLAPTSDRHGAHVRGKSWINEQLESNGAPTFWTCNDISAFDPAHLRRFDFVIEMRTPPRSVRRRIVERYFGSCHVSPRCMDELAEIEQVPPAVLERSAHVVQVLAAGNATDCDGLARRQVHDTLRAMGVRYALRAPVLPSSYDVAFTNANIDLDALMAGLRKRPNACICLYGPPGTGKTAFAHHVGHCLDLPVQVRRTSDLLECFVGVTEQNIARAFARARDEHALLVIDEADSFLRDRECATRSWEVTQVNELLTQMEFFEGIFIASTNLMSSLDAAALRRFDFKIRCDYMKPEQRRALLARVCNVAPAMLNAATCRELDHLDLATPGDFANVLRQLSVFGQAPSPERMIELLATEVALKPGARRHPIGFVA